MMTLERALEGVVESQRCGGTVALVAFPLRAVDVVALRRDIDLATLVLSTPDSEDQAQDVALILANSGAVDALALVGVRVTQELQVAADRRRCELLVVA